jgi:hypothetical protein
MTVTPTSTMIVLDLRAADSNPRRDTAMPTNLCRRECRPFERWKWTQLRRTALEHRSRAQSNRLALAAPDPASTATVPEPWPLSP